MGLGAFVSGGATIEADKQVDALYRAIVQYSEVESQANRDSIGQTSNTVQYQILGDAQKSFTATLNLPARMVKDLVTGVIDLKVRNPFVDYITWVPGTGDLAATASLPEAIVLLCNSITYLERQIDPNIVIQTPNQVNITPNQEAGTFDIQITLPAGIVVDPLTGQINFEMFDYLFVLDV